MEVLFYRLSGIKLQGPNSYLYLETIDLPTFLLLWLLSINSVIRCFLFCLINYYLVFLKGFFPSFFQTSNSGELSAFLSRLTPLVAPSCLVVLNTTCVLIIHIYITCLDFYTQLQIGMSKNLCSIVTFLLSILVKLHRKEACLIFMVIRRQTHCNFLILGVFLKVLVS